MNGGMKGGTRVPISRMDRRSCVKVASKLDKVESTSRKITIPPAVVRASSIVMVLLSSRAIPRGGTTSMLD